MEALHGPALIAASVLLLAGGQKVVDPAPTAGALRAQRFPSGMMLVRALAMAEIGVATAAIVAGWAAAWVAVGVFYLGFVLFVGLALHRDLPLASCGCFGRDDTPPTRIHLAVDAVFALAALGVAPAARPLDQLLADQPAAGAPFLGFLLAGIGLTWLTLAVLPGVLRPASLRPMTRCRDTAGARP